MKVYLLLLFFVVVFFSGCINYMPITHPDNVSTKENISINDTPTIENSDTSNNYCESINDCLLNQSCIKNKCAPAECLENSDCQSGLVCNNRYKYCTLSVEKCNSRGDNTCVQLCYNDSDCIRGNCSRVVLRGNDENLIAWWVCENED